MARRLERGWEARPIFWGRVGLLIGVTGFAIFAGWVWTERYLAFETYAWDLGIYNQAFYTTVFNHLLFYYTADLPAGTHGSVFAAHFSPILFPLLPLYAIAAGPPALLAIQAVALALGAVPVYYLAQFYLKSTAWALLFAGIYLVTPLTLGTGWYDFHPEALLPVTTLTAFYFFARGRRWPFLAAWIATLAVIETAAPLLLLFAGAVSAGALWRLYRRKDRTVLPELRLALLGLAVAGGWLAVSLIAITALSATGGTFGGGYAGNWSVLGATSIYNVIPYALVHPSAAWNALTYDGWAKLAYVAVLFGSVALLSFWGQRRYLVMIAGWLALALLSNSRPYYLFGDQYLGYVLAPLVAGAITGLHRILEDPRVPLRHPWRVRTTVGGLLVAVVVSSLLISPLLPVNSLSFGVPHGIPAQTSHDELLHQVIGEVPADAAILTTPTIFPEVSNRPNAFVDPVSTFFAGNITFFSVLNQYVNESQYVLLDYLVDYSNSVIVAKYANLTGFGLETAVDGVYLYERGWTGPPSWWVPLEYTVAPKELTLFAGQIISGVLVYRGPAPLNATIWGGPGIQALAPGIYAIQAPLRVASPTAGPQLRLDMLQEPIEVEVHVQERPGGRDYSFQFVPDPANLTLVSTSTFSLASPSGGTFGNVTTVGPWTNPGFLEFPGTTTSPDMSLDLYPITVVQVVPG